jgi:O-antigen/teichoic acid export membrane protein
MVAMRLTVNVLGLASTVVLARLLTPQDFGLVALAGSAYTFFAMFGQFGFDIPLIQLQKADRSYYDTAWTANILVGVFVAVAMFSVGKLASVYFKDERIEYIVYSFSLLSMAKGFENIGVVNFRKQLLFGGEFLYFVVPKLTSLIVGVGAAFVLRNYWALVVGMIAAQLSGLLYSHFAQPFRPRLSLSRFSELFTFGKWILASKFLRFLTFNGIEIVVGRIQGPVAVGIFTMARRVSFIPSNEIAAPINRALFPSFATISNEANRLRNAFRKTVSVTAILSFPAAFGILAIADPLVYVVFGERWMPAAPVLGVMALVGVLYATNNIVEPVLMARGALKPLVLAQLGFALLLLPAAVVLTDRFGAAGAAYALLASSLAALPMHFYAAGRVVGFSVRDLARCVWRPLAAAALMGVAVAQARELVIGSDRPTLATLVAVIAAGTIVYPAALALLWLPARNKAESAELLIIEMVRKRFGRPR